MYADENVMKKYPFFVRFDGEKAVDLGGVTRDMFSAFFEVLYLKLFDGSSLFYPTTNACFWTPSRQNCIPLSCICLLK
jgi:hypothetical protein